MKRWVQALGTGAMLVAVNGWAADEATEPAASESKESAAPMYRPYARLSQNEFLWVLKKGNENEADLAKVAVRKASARDVKEYARTLERDHRQASRDVEKFAKRHKFDLAKPIRDMRAGIQELDDRSVQMTKDRLRLLHGAAFDNQFLSVVVEEHKTSIGKLKVAEQAFKGWPLSSLIAELLPPLERHLDRGHQLMQGMGVGGAGSGVKGKPWYEPTTPVVPWPDSSKPPDDNTMRPFNR